MKNSSEVDWILILDIVIMVFISIVVLRSLSPNLFPLYFVYLLLGLITFYIFSKIDFEILLLFSPHLYILSILFLIAPLIIGQVTRGAIRWIPLGSLTIQPSELVRPFLLLFFANYLNVRRLDSLRLLKSFFYLLAPFTLILVQPSLGVAILTAVGFIGVILASRIEKKYFLMAGGVLAALAPLLWLVLAPYQKDRILSFANPGHDPYGIGYNTIQSVISVGSGKFLGRGLGEGVQTQLAFLPEKHSDFIFAAVAEELGFLGAAMVIAGLFTLFWRIILVIEKAGSPSGRGFASGVFLVLFVEAFIHIGMNMGLLPITGVPLPLVSAGGSAFLGTVISLAISMKVRE